MKLSKNLAFLEKAFAVLNRKYFENTLSKTVVTIQSAPKTYGHFTPSETWADDEQEYKEINIAAETLNRPLEETLATLVHEMVHQYCDQNDIKDTSRAGAYHNKRFKSEAEKRGLLISYNDRIGWSVTKPGNEFIEFCRKQWPEEIKLFRKNTAAVKTKKKSSTRKYACPSCGLSIRATREINVICGDCEEQLQPV